MGVRAGAGEAPLAGGTDGTDGGFEAGGGGALGRAGAVAAFAAVLTLVLGRGAGGCAGPGAGGFMAARGATSGRDDAPLEPAPGIIGRGGNSTGRPAFWPLAAAVGAALGAATDGGGAWRDGA